MDISFGVCVALILGGLPLLGLLLWWWNELWHVLPLKLRHSSTNLPPGYMGFPFFGEMLTFIWYFEVLRRLDDFINAKRVKYGDGVRMYRTHLFGSPSIITCFPAVNKFVLQSDDSFILEGPNADLMGPTSLVSVQGKSHARLTGYLTKVINTPDALRRIALLVQPRIIAALGSWAHKGSIKAYNETNKDPARPGTYQAFGGGSRICAGNMLVRLQLAMYPVGYKWKLLNPDANMMYLSHPRLVDGVEVTFSKIKNEFSHNFSERIDILLSKTLPPQPQ